MPRDLAVIITARNEEWLARTVEDVLAKKEMNTEIIVILDGNWADPPILDHKDITIIYHSESIGQRQAINEGIKLSDAKYIIKLDAHCIVAQGFDRVLCEDGDKLGKNVTQVPRMYNIHAFNWKCKKCGNEWYQSPTPSHCQKPGEKRGNNPDCDSTEFERVIVWKIREHKRSDFMRFDSDLKFQYWGALGTREESKVDIAETMSFVGACFFMRRDRYWELGGSEEEWGSWGQQGTEISCKSWLSGGRVVVNKKTWFAHLFRTQGQGFGFPYPQSGKQQEHARKRSKEFFLQNNWKGQTRPLSWLLEKFWPIPGWEDKDLKNVKASEGRFTKIDSKPTKAILYFTDGNLNPKIMSACQKQLLKANLPIYSVTLKPMDFGKNIVLPLERGYLTLYKQILIGLELMTEDIVFPVDHDTLYHPSHWEFTPEKKDVYYYNLNEWRVRAKDGFALHYDAKNHHALACYRSLLIQYYREKISRVEEAMKTMDAHQLNYFLRRMGCEPGTHTRAERLDRYQSQTWWSKSPNIDIRHDKNLTASRWRKDQFRDQRNCTNWIESSVDKIPEWSNFMEIIK